MNNYVFQQAQTAYENQDYAQALDLFNATVSDNKYPLESEEYGLLCHQIGNCFIKLNNYSDAISAYMNATNDEDYSARGTVFYNLGMAYVYMNDFANAIENFKTAVNDSNYKSKYKAYTAMGNAMMKSGKSAEAGATFRQAALDPNNPDPTRALLNLGVCFMALGRPQDAVVSYESAFQFDTNADVRNRLYANLGQAYVSTGQMEKAVSSFEKALADKTYHLSDSASVDYQKAIAFVSKGNSEIPINNSNMSNSDQNVVNIPSGEAVDAAAGATAAIAAGAVSPQIANAAENISGVTQNLNNPQQSPASIAAAQTGDLSGLDIVNDTMYNANSQQNTSVLQNPVYVPQQNGEGVQDNGAIDDKFFEASDKEFDAWTKSAKSRANKPKKRHKGLKIFFIVFLILVLLGVIGGAFLYTQGYGFPTQEMITKELFSNPIDVKDKVYAVNVSDSKKVSYTNMISQDSNVRIDGVNRSMNESTVYATSRTSNGGEVNYKLKMTRDLVGWKVQTVDLAFASQEQQ